MSYGFCPLLLARSLRPLLASRSDISVVGGDAHPGEHECSFGHEHRACLPTVAVPADDSQAGNGELQSSDYNCDSLGSSQLSNRPGMSSSARVVR